MIFLLLFALTIDLNRCEQISFVDNAQLIPQSSTKIETLTNHSCIECLCSQFRNESKIINCFSDNQTCQFLFDFPRRYRVENKSAARIYFPQNSLPNGSEHCCMANLDELLEKLRRKENSQGIQVDGPRCLAIDPVNHYLVTVKDQDRFIYRFHLRNLSTVNVEEISNAILMNIVYHENAYYLSDNMGKIIIVDSTNFNQLGHIDGHGISLPRDILFLDGGRTLVIGSDKDLIFFNRSNLSTYHFTHVNNQPTVDFGSPHGLFFVNDTFFHVASWDGNRIYSYFRTANNSWDKVLFADATSVPSTNTAGSHVMIDKCQRRWFSIYGFGIMIYDEHGNYLGNLTRDDKKYLFDAVLLDDYVLYLSYVYDNYIERIDPKIHC